MKIKQYIFSSNFAVVILLLLLLFICPLMFRDGDDIIPLLIRVEVSGVADVVQMSLLHKLFLNISFFVFLIAGVIVAVFIGYFIYNLTEMGDRAVIKKYFNGEKINFIENTKTVCVICIAILLIYYSLDLMYLSKTADILLQNLLVSIRFK